MAELSLPTATRVWASALGDLYPVPDEKLSVLQRVCNAGGVADAPNASAGSVLQRLLPIIMFLKNSSGKCEDKLLAPLVESLRLLPQRWMQQQAGPVAVQGEFTELMAASRWLLQSPDVPGSLKQQLSPALAYLLKAMWTHTLAVEDPASPGWLKSGCHLLLRALTRTPEFTGNSSLPLMPADAEQLLQWAVQSLTPPGTSADTAAAAGSQGGSSRAMATGELPAMLLQDDKLHLILSKLVATAYGERGSSQTHSNGSNGSSSYAVRKGLLQHDPQLMGQLLSWSSSLVKRSLDDVMHSTDDSTAGAMSREAAYAASHLASTCVHQLLASQELGTSRTAGLKQHLYDVIDVALSVAEASIAMGSSSTLRLQPEADKALMLSARILEGATPFVAALTRSSSPPEQLQLATRLKAVVQNAARLTLLASKTAAAAEEAPGPVAALGQKLLNVGLGPLRLRRAALVQRSEARMELAQRSIFARPVKSYGLTPSGAQQDAQDIIRQLEPLLQNPWNWDVAQPLTRVTHGVTVRQVPLEAVGWGPQLLARSAAEMWVKALAASWRQGEPMSVRALMLLPVTGSVQEAMVVALTAGRLYTKLGADAALGQLLLPLLAVYLTNSPVCSAEMAGALVCSLEGMAAAAVKHSDGAWVYKQAVQLLLKLYREPTPVSRQLLAGRDAHPTVSGLLADALESLAEALSNAPNKHRLQLRSKLLLLFTDVGLRLGSSGTGASGLEATDLGELLPAVATAAEGLQPRTLSLLGASSSRMSMQEIQSAQREDASATRLFRTLWLYASLHKLVDPTTLLSTTYARSAAGDSTGDVNPEWQQAAGRLAAVTPLLVVGTDNYIEDDMVERLQVELGQQLVRAGKLGNTGPMMSALQQLVQPQGSLPVPGKDVLVAFILAVAMAELSRAALAPLPDPDEDGILACPVPITLGYLQGVLPEGVASAWLGAIVRRSFQLYLQRLCALQEAQLAGGPVEPSATRAALAYAEQLAQALIQHLGDAGGAVDGSTPAVAALSNTLLEQLLDAFPALYFSRPCYRALFAQLQREEGDLPMGQVQASGGRIVWERTQAWVTAAAQLAPATTEALLHSFICSTAVVGTQTDTFLHPMSRSMSVGAAGGLSRGESPVPSSNLSALANGHAPASYSLQQKQQAAARALVSADSGLLSNSSSREGFHASQAAFRRAADLLQICGAARTQQQAAGADGAYEGTLAFARKLHYSGAVAGLMQGSAEEEDVLGNMGSDTTAGTARRQQVAEQIVDHLEDLLQEPRAPQAALDDAHLSASALLAVEQHRFAFTQLGQRLLKDLCSAPLQRLTPATVKLAMFSWAWVTAEAPEVLVQLVSSVVSAWVWTVDQRRGLFSGQPHPTPASADALSGSSSGADTGAGQEQQKSGVGNDTTLQAIAAHHVWLSYLLELWSVVSLLGDEREAAVQQKFARLLYVSLANPGCLTHHPAAVGAYFRLLQLGLAFGRSQLRSGHTLSSHPVPVLLLFDQILRAGLLWFKSPPRYYARWTRSAAAEQVVSLEQFQRQLRQVLVVTQGTWPSAFVGGSTGGPGPSSAHPVWGCAAPDVAGYVQLLQFLCGEELKRLMTWVDPADPSSHPTPVPSSTPWERYVKLAWEVDAGLAVGLLAHFPMAAAARRALEALVAEHASDTRVQKVPAAAALLVSAAQRQAGLSLRPLATWQPGAAELGLQLLSGEAGDQPDVRTYSIKCLFNEPPERVVFFLPQLVQLLRGDDGAISSFFLTTARHSDVFAHNLMWALASESRPPEEAFNPEVKRSGWQPPKDTGLWSVAAELRSQIEAGMNPAQRAYWEAEDSYFTQVTNLSGYLYKFSKDERRSKLQKALATFKPPREDLYLPTNADCRVVGHIPSSGACMQSAAKVPILVAFNVIPHTHPADTSHPEPGAAREHAPTANGNSSSTVAAAAGGAPVPSPPTQKMACIFKVGDDIRQDVLAIQVITLLRDAFERAGLGLYLRPYGCLPTGYECGIIEVVPNCKSRAALGELSDRGLYDIFTAEFGAPGSPAFERARFNFIVSEAAYAVASYLLQAKDRHNGNIMLDDRGHIVHIDFGFILEISPGGNLGFESAAFKLSHEMAQVLDPGGLRASPQFRLFEELAVRAYLAARTVAEPIIATVALMANSGLPCFGRGAPVANLRQRFRLDLNDAQAAGFMRQTIADAYDKWTTGFYDYIQSLQNKIPY